MLNISTFVYHYDLNDMDILNSKGMNRVYKSFNNYTSIYCGKVDLPLHRNIRDFENELKYRHIVIEK